MVDPQSRQVTVFCPELILSEEDKGHDAYYTFDEVVPVHICEDFEIDFRTLTEGLW